MKSTITGNLIGCYAWLFEDFIYFDKNCFIIKNNVDMWIDIIVNYALSMDVFS